MSHPLRILFVVPYVPSRMRIRPLAFIRELARQGHEVTLVSLAQPVREMEYLNDVTPFCKAVHCLPIKPIEAYFHTLSSLPTQTPLSVAYCQSSSCKNIIQELILKNGTTDHWDVIHTEFIRAVPYTSSITGIPKVYDSVDCLSLAYQRGVSAPYLSLTKRATAWLELIKIKHYESTVMKHYDRILVSSPEDRHALVGKHDHMQVLPNGVDHHYFAFSDHSRNANTIVFLGKMNYYVNVASVLWFYHKVFPSIRNQFPKVKFQILGRDPVKAIQDLSMDPSVEVTGAVADVRPYLSLATVAVGPMVAGSGIQNKILEAMSVGTPCVVTSIVSQALQVQDGKDLMVADLPEQFAQRVGELMENPKKANEIGWNGRRYIEQQHDWREIGTQLVQIYSELSQHHVN